MLYAIAVFPIFLLAQIAAFLLNSYCLKSRGTPNFTHNLTAIERGKFMQDRRQGPRHVVSFPIRVKWKTEDGQVFVEEGLTENVGLNGALVYLPRMLPTVGSKVDLTVTENTKEEITVGAQVIRLERNAAHPQVALTLTEGMRTWKKKVWDLAAETVAGLEPEEVDDWS